MIYVSGNGVPINYSLARSLYNDHRSTTAFNSFPRSWSVSSLASQTERTIGSHGDRLRLARSNLPEMRSGNRAETSVRHERGKSWRRTPGGMFVRLAAITGYPRRLYSDRVYRRRLSFPCSRVPRSKRRSADDFVSPPSYVLGGGESDVLSSTPSSQFFVARPESPSRISGRIISIAQSSVNYASARYNV